MASIVDFTPLENDEDQKSDRNNKIDGTQRGNK